jgi:hypothetical protein
MRWCDSNTTRLSDEDREAADPAAAASAADPIGACTRGRLPARDVVRGRFDARIEDTAVDVLIAALQTGNELTIDDRSIASRWREL